MTGNPDTRRDFTDVRDVVRAYRLLAERAEPGIYNVCSGRSISAAEQVGLLAELLAPIEVEHEVDPARVRAHEVMDLRGANDRLTRRDRLAARDPAAPDDARHDRVLGARAGLGTGAGLRFGAARRAPRLRTRSRAAGRGREPLRRGPLANFSFVLDGQWEGHRPSKRRR